MARGGEAFVGRREPLAALAAELHLGADRPRVVWVVGEPGVGKTSLVRAALARPGGKRRVVWAAAAEEERDLPYGVLEQLARGLAGGQGRPQQPWPAAGAGADPLAVGADLLVAMAASAVPLVLVVEDLQWADEESARALLFAVRRLQSEPVVVVVTSHPDALAGGGWPRLLGDPARARRLELGGLDAAELTELAEILGVGRLDPETARQLRDHTGGHPLHARALLVEVGVARLVGRAGVLPAPRVFATLIVARLGSLHPEARRLVAAVAVLGPASRLADAAAVAALGDPVPACDAAIGAGLLEWLESQMIGFPHPLLRAAVYNDLTLESRRAMHLAAATVTEGVAALEHRAAAAFGPDAALAAELAALAARESAEGRAVLAARHWRQAAALSAAPRDRDHDVLLAIEGLFAAGMTAQVRALRADAEACTDPVYRSYALGFVAFAEGRIAESEKLASDALDRLGPGAPRLAAALGFTRMLLGQWETSEAACRTSLDGDAGWAAGMARYALALCDIHLGRLGDLGRLRHRVEADLAQGALPRCEALTVLGMIDLWMGDVGQAAGHLGEVVTRSRAGERTRMLASVLAGLSEAHFWLGRWDDAVVAAELGVSLARDGEQIIGLQQALSVAGTVHARCGRFDLAESHLDELATLGSLLPWWGAAPLLGVGRGVLAEARGDSAAMLRAVAPLLDPTASYPRRQPRPWAILAIDALLGAGDTVGAAEQLEAFGNLVRVRKLAAPAAELARLRGRLAESRGDLAAAETHYRSGTTAPAAYPYTRARAHLALGRLLRATGRPGEATQELLAAQAQFSALGALPDLHRCNAELAECGQPVRQTGASDQLGLTEAELSVANLAAQRLTNREVAARLYISTKTVEYHLSHVYTKLNIAGRRQLPSRIGHP